MNLYDVAVIGAGASGMMAALGAGELGASVLLLDGNEKEGKKILNTIRTLRPFCPECGEPLIFEGGCNICKSCGYTKCD